MGGGPVWVVDLCGWCTCVGGRVMTLYDSACL